ncbi:MAG: hypothetical protein U0572_13800 [Phycisphaerales bacterium]
MKKVLDWVKANVLIVVLAVVGIASIGLGWFFGDTLNGSVQRTAKERAARITDLESLEKSNVTLNIPGREPATKTVVINERLLQQYREATEQLKSDADKIRELALARNKRDHEPVLPGVFPAPPATQRELVPSEMQKAIEAAYGKLFAEIHAGQPAPADEIAATLSRREMQFIQSTLKKANRESLDDKEKKTLADDLAMGRLALYEEQAQKIGVYMAPNAVQIPPPQGSGRALASLSEMFDWQWRYWIVRDILLAVVDANEAASGRRDGSVLRSPVKRILSIRIDPPEFLVPASSGGGGGGGAGFGAAGGGFGAAGGDAGAAAPAPDAAAVAAANAPLGVPQIDMTGEAPRDYSRSFTGRQKTPVYDVRRATVQAIVATNQLPLFFDALAQRNFITVTNVRIQPADPFLDAEQGFLYGKDPVSTVTFELESVWLRAWVAPLMPAEVRTALGIQSVPQADAAPAAGAKTG